MKDIYLCAANFIAFFEGFISTARWDVNAYRLGFGSDTEGPDQFKVTAGMTTTRGRALQNLALRIPVFEAVIIKQIGIDRWTSLSDSTKVALLDFTYNYGRLTTNVANAASVDTLADEVLAVEAREGDNGAINAKRRHAEAAMIVSGL